MPEESIGPNWSKIESDVLRKIQIIHAAWEHTQAQAPGVHEIMKRDLYVPALTCLAEFCACVEEKDAIHSSPN